MNAIAGHGLAAEPAHVLPAQQSLRDFHRHWAGQSVLVCGCGRSASLAASAEAPTIGVNDIGRLFTPNYLVVVNPPRQFRGDRFTHVRQSRAQALFTQLDLGPVEPPVVRFPLGRYGGLPAEGDAALHYTQNSPYVAVCLAAHMGARRIGLIGVDFTDHHFFAATGRHPLAGRLAAIDREYGALAQALAARGIELVNLSPVSRLQSLPRMPLERFVPATPVVSLPAAATRRRRVFVVDYRFQTCGDVIAEGLRHAAATLGVEHAQATWDDPRLPECVAAFAPDLLLVVHGRRFAQRWGRRFSAWRSAVWLVDEPYEVDDTAAWSGHFDTVIVNDPATLARHARSHYLPMCFDSEVCADPGAPRPYAVGFIGGANPVRERFLLALAEAGLLSYIVGGPWRHPLLRRLTRASVVPPAETARLYQQTEIVINVFRDRHHFNRQGLAAQAMNPRIYEALACGALVVSERRSEIAGVFPELPQFDTPDEALALARRLLADRSELERLRRDCRERLAGHAYTDRLQAALALALGTPAEAPPPREETPAMPLAQLAANQLPAPPKPPSVVPRSASPLALQALPGTPRRHLLYHLWPVRGGTWRWNVEQLLQRVELFNGRRIVGVVHDARTEDPALVRLAFDGHGFEFVELPNAAHGEAATFPHLLESLAGEGPHDVSFYAHAKGVKYEPVFPPAVKRWAEVQYAVTLDHWPAVREQLDRFAMTGILRRLGRFANHQHVGDWHYSGTFFWFRHDAVFGPRRAAVPQFYGGVEAWPGVLFSRHETGCLLLDNQRELPYHERFWAQRGNPAYAQWKTTLRALPAPSDLLQPPPFDGHAAPRLEQRPEEFEWWLQRLLAERVQRLLVFGAGHGGEEWHVARRFCEAGLDIQITTRAASPRPAWQAAAADAQARFGQTVRAVDDARAALPQGVDAAFIDGDHGWRACRADLAVAESLGARLVGLHDIVDSDWHAQARCAVSRVWQALQREHAHDAMASSRDWAGIGIVQPQARR